MRKILILVLIALVSAGSKTLAAQGEMGTGVPNFLVYSSATGIHMSITVVSLDSQSIAFPTGCTSLTLTPETMGLDTYKMAFAMLTAAKLSGSRIRFYAHVSRDSGCGVDLVSLP
jgi:hypothetical protein